MSGSNFELVRPVQHEFEGMRNSDIYSGVAIGAATSLGVAIPVVTERLMPAINEYQEAQVTHGYGDQEKLLNEFTEAGTAVFVPAMLATMATIAVSNAIRYRLNARRQRATQKKADEINSLNAAFYSINS